MEQETINEIVDAVVEQHATAMKKDGMYDEEFGSRGFSKFVRSIIQIELENRDIPATNENMEKIEDAVDDVFYMREIQEENRRLYTPYQSFIWPGWKP